MLKYLIATTALSLALAAPAVSFAADPVPSTTASASINADKLIKADLRNAQGDRIGEVESVLLDQAGKSQAVIVDVGGFLGMGEHRVALAWTELTVSSNGDKVTTRYTKDQLKAMPTYSYPNVKHRNTAFYDPAFKAVSTTAERAVDKVDRTISSSSADWHALNTDMKMSKVLGADIRSGNDTIGDVDEAIVDRTGKIRAIVVDVGGFLGVGNKHVALDFERLQVSQKDDSLRFATTMTKDQLKSLPEFKEHIATGSATRSSGGAASDPKKY